jgi:hypothetical protein
LRTPICANVLWRQQPDNDQGIIRTAQVRYTGEAANGPFEQYDLSGFCATEDHAVKVGAFRVARRRYITHTLQLSLRPGAVATALGIGDVVRVFLQRETTLGVAGVHNYLYEVNQISRSISGLVTLDLVHFPVDTAGASLIALAVAGATGAGYSLPTGKSGVSCDTNSSSATTEITSSGGNLGSLPSSDNFQEDITPPATEPGPTPAVIEKGDGNTDSDPQVGDTVAAPIICSGATVTWYRKDPSAPGGKVLVQAPSSGLPYTMVINDKDLSVYADIQCPGAASAVSSKELGPVKGGSTEIYNAYGLYRFEWTLTSEFSSGIICSTGASVSAYNDPSSNILDTLTYNDGNPQYAYGAKIVYGPTTSLLTEICAADGPNLGSTTVDLAFIYTQSTSGGPWVLRGGIQGTQGTVHSFYRRTRTYRRSSITVTRYGSTSP